MPVLLLDRDGVINHDSAEFIKSADEFVPIDGSVAAIAVLTNSAGRCLSRRISLDLGANFSDEFALAQMHEKLITLVEEAGGTISGIAFCPHLPDAGCECRKPGVGLLTEIEHVFSVALSGEPFVGDSLRDLEAAIAFGCQPILVRTGKGRETEARLISEPALLGEVKVPVFDDLASFVATLN